MAGRKAFRILKWSLGILSFLILILFGFFLSVYFGAFGKLYTEEELRHIQTFEASETYSEDGKLLGSFFWENRSNAKRNEIPDHLIKALIATEDARFYEHNGVDFRSILRVFFKTLLMGDKKSGGGSTLAQQLSKNLFKRQSYGIFTMPVNKIKEAVHAVRLTRIFKPDEILMLYLNTVSVGEDTYGIKNAARRFFNTSPDSLRVEQSALLIGMLKSPTLYNPRLRPSNALSRRNIVLQNMSAQGYLNQEVSDSLKNLPLNLQYKYVTMYGEVAPYFTRQVELLATSILDTIKNESGKKFNLYTDGLKIYTPLNTKLQGYSLFAMQKHMKFLQNLLDKQYKNSDILKRSPVIVSNELKNSERYKRLTKSRIRKKEIDKILKTPEEKEIFGWNGVRTVAISPLDSIRYYLKLLHAGILSIDPSNGNVKVWIGGNDFSFFKYDHIRAKRQVGSTFKPIVYATAIERGMSPCDYIRNERHVYSQFGGWSPENSDGFYGGKYSLKGALANSVNVVSVEVLLKAGIGNVINKAHQMGISSDIPAVPSLALGVANISLLEMVNAYCVFANQGRSVSPVLISRIEDRHGKVVYTANQNPGKQVFSKQTAAYTIDMLKAVIDEGTAQKVRSFYKINGEMAGKTGTTQSNTDGWFIGFTPHLVTGVWVGADNPAIRFYSTAYGQGSHTALPIWSIFVKESKSDKALKKYFDGTFFSKQHFNLPECESYKKDTFFDKLKNLFRRKDKPQDPGRKKRKFLFW